jgi:hypothetical protein
MMTAKVFAFAPFHSRLPLNHCAALRFTPSLRSAPSAPFRFFRSILRSTALQAVFLELVVQFRKPQKSCDCPPIAKHPHQGTRRSGVSRFADCFLTPALFPKTLNTLALSELILFSLRRALRAEAAHRADVRPHCVKSQRTGYSRAVVAKRHTRSALSSALPPELKHSGDFASLGFPLHSLAALCMGRERRCFPAVGFKPARESTSALARHASKDSSPFQGEERWGFLFHHVCQVYK